LKQLLRMNKRILFQFLLSLTFMMSASLPSIYAQQPDVITNSNEDLKAKIYPSEIKEGYFFIAIPEATEINEINIKIVNLIGSNIAYTVQKTMDGKFRVEMEDLSSGIYIVRVTKGYKQTTQRIIVRAN